MREERKKRGLIKHPALIPSLWAGYQAGCQFTPVICYSYLQYIPTGAFHLPTYWYTYYNYQLYLLD